MKRSEVKNVTGVSERMAEKGATLGRKKGAMAAEVA